MCVRVSKVVRASHGQVNDSKQSSSDLTGKFLVFCKSGCSREVVAYDWWSPLGGSTVLSYTLFFFL